MEGTWGRATAVCALLEMDEGRCGKAERRVERSRVMGFVDNWSTADEKIDYVASLGRVLI